MFPIFDINKPHFVKCVYKEQHEGFGKYSCSFKSIILNYLYFFQEGNLQRNWQEQQETKEVALANLTLHTQRIPKDNNPIKVGLSFSEGSNTLLNIDIGESLPTFYCNDLFVSFQVSIKIFLDHWRLQEPGVKIKYLTPWESIYRNSKSMPLPIGHKRTGSSSSTCQMASWK